MSLCHGLRRGINHLAAAPFLAGLLNQATDFTTATLTAAAVAALAAAALLRPPGETTSPRRV